MRKNDFLAIFSGLREAVKPAESDVAAVSFGSG
jgi:hypothetical protein